MLLEGYEAAYKALTDAESALCRIEFNARDYYVQGPEAWPQAAKEMDARLKKLQEVREELLEIMRAIYNEERG